jgi:uracil-DNA glycosylase
VAIVKAFKPVRKVKTGMTLKPGGCQGCPRFTKGLGFVPPRGRADSKYIVVGQCPTADDASQSIPFFDKGYVGERMTSRLYKAGLQQSDVIFTTLVWCANKGETPWTKLVPPAHAAVKHCWKHHLGPYLNSIQESSRVPHIITVGDAPLRWFKRMTQKEPTTPHYGTTELHEAPEVKT